jgi:hypothetical protein
MAKEYRYTVRGHWPFPTDMLRHDQASGQTRQDVEQIAALATEHAEDRDAFTDVEIALVADSRPNVERWNSFGWFVVAANFPVPDEPKRPKVVGGIDLTPTWKAAMPIIIAALQDGTPEGKRLAREELMDLADRLDRMNVAPTKKEG